MGKRLRTELKQSKPFVSAEEEAFLNLQRTAEALMWGLAETLKPAGLTPTQYNVLRILRGAGEEGLPCGEISGRMVTKDSDITRLLDRLEAQKLIERTRGEKDRRIVVAYITPEGLRLLDSLDDAVVGLHRRQLAHLGARRLAALSDALEAAREKVG